RFNIGVWSHYLLFHYFSPPLKLFEVFFLSKNPNIPPGKSAINGKSSGPVAGVEGIGEGDTIGRPPLVVVAGTVFSIQNCVFAWLIWPVFAVAVTWLTTQVIPFGRSFGSTTFPRTAKFLVSLGPRRSTVKVRVLVLLSNVPAVPPGWKLTDPGKVSFTAVWEIVWPPVFVTDS